MPVTSRAGDLGANNQVVKVRSFCDGVSMPARGTERSAGYDLSATQGHIGQPGETCAIPTGVGVEFQAGRVGMICSRSSTAKIGVVVTGGVIDQDYRGEIIVLLCNNSAKTFVVGAGQRIAQLIILPCVMAPVVQAQQLAATGRWG